MSESLSARLNFLARVVEKEMRHLQFSSEHVFEQPLTLEKISSLESEPHFAETIEAYTSRFCRLQDTLGDKLLPAWLESLGESTRSVVDNLDRAQKLGINVDSEEWLIIRQLRNKMVHEYIESKELFLSALLSAHDFEPKLYTFGETVLADVRKRVHKSC